MAMHVFVMMADDRLYRFREAASFIGQRALRGRLARATDPSFRL